MAAAASILPYTPAEAAISHAVAAPERRFVSVTCMSNHDIPKVKEILEVWLQHVNRVMLALHKSPGALDPKKITSDLDLCKNYRNTHKALRESVHDIGEDPSLAFKVLLAKDSEGKIQAALSYSTVNPKNLSVLELLSAPWNLRWSIPTIEIPTPLRGGGVMLLDAACKIALKDGAGTVSLVSEDIACPFYRKVGMREPRYPLFVFEVNNPEDQAKMQAAMQRAFGTDFHYSLLLEESKEI